MRVAVVHGIVTLLAQADKIATVQRQLRVMLYWKNVVNVLCLPDASVSLALLALVAVPPKDSVPCTFPLGCVVYLFHSGINKRRQPVKAAS